MRMIYGYRVRYVTLYIFLQHIRVTMTYTRKKTCLCPGIGAFSLLRQGSAFQGLGLPVPNPNLKRNLLLQTIIEETPSGECLGESVQTHDLVQ